jgi:DNA-directed RNA polymerase I and III subunit RPAC1
LNNTQDEDKLYNNANVMSGDLQWVPVGNQEETFADKLPKSLLEDILIAKMRPGQEIEMDLVVEKGLGKTHAKWSPVCTAYYRLLNDIKLKAPVTGKDAELLKKTCPMGVFDIEDIGKGNNAVVGDADKCTMCRECVRSEKFADIVDLGKILDAFEFHVETVGVKSPESLVTEALSILKKKAVKWI